MRIILQQLNNGHGQRLRDWFDEAGASPKQIDIRPNKGSVTYFLKLHNEIDLMLNPFPYNGTPKATHFGWACRFSALRAKPMYRDRG